MYTPVYAHYQFCNDIISSLILLIWVVTFNKASICYQIVKLDNLYPQSALMMNWASTSVIRNWALLQDPTFPKQILNALLDMLL